MAYAKHVLKLSTFLFFTLCSSFLVAQDAVYGEVRDGMGNALPGAHVIIQSNSSVAVTDALGRFELSLSEGEYRLQVTAVGFDTLNATFKVPLNKKLRYSLTSSAISMAMVTVEEHKSITDASTGTIHVTRSDMQLQTESSLSGILSANPGVRTMNTGAGIGKPVIRGMSGNRIQVISQGVKQEGQQWGNDHGLEIDAFEPEQVEIIKGAAALRYGSDATAGVIRILPGAPVEEGQTSVSPEVIFKSNNNLYGGSIGFAKGFSKVYVRARYTQTSAADFTVPTDSFTYNTYVLPIYNQRLKNTAFREQHFSAALGLKGYRASGELSYTMYGLNSGLFSGAMGIPRSYDLQHDGNYRAVSLPYQDITHHKFAGRGVVDVGDNHIHFTVGHQLNRREEHAQPHNHGLTFLDTTNTLALGLDLETTTASLFMETELSKSIRLEYGVNGSFLTNTTSGYEYLIPNYNRWNSGAFVLGSWTPAETWEITGGMRYDISNTDAGGAPSRLRNISGGITEVLPPANGFTRLFTGMSGAVGVSKRFGGYTQKVLVSNTFRVPNIAELAGDGIHHGTYRHERGDSTLSPERGWQFDWTHTYEEKRFFIELNAFAYRFSNYIYLNPSPFFSELPDGGQVYQYTQSAAWFIGGELNAELRLTKRIRLREGFEYVRAQNTVTTLPLPFIPPVRNQLEIRYEVGPLSAFLKWEHVFAQDRVERNERETPQASLLHAGITGSFSLGKVPIQATVAANNLLNTPFYDHLSRYRQLNIPEPGRNIMVRFKVPLKWEN